MARILLINPPIEALGLNGKCITKVLFPSPPGGLASIAASLIQDGHEVRIRDLVVMPESVATLMAYILEFRPDAIGFSVLGSAFFSTQRIVSQIKTRLPEIYIFVGNALPSEYPGWFFESMPECDAIVIGEGEITTTELIRSGFKDTIPGALLRGEDIETYSPRPQINDLDALPFPAWQLLPYDSYKASPQLMFRSKPTLGLLQSRGCPWKCGFCAQNHAWPDIRFRSLESLAEEIERNFKDFNINHFGFYDSIFPFKREFGEELYRELEKRGLIGRIRFFCETRLDMVWEDTFSWLKKAGMYLVLLGIESTNAGLLKNQNKAICPHDAVEAVKILKRVGLKVYGLFMIGFPGETGEDRESLGKFASSLPLDVASFGINTLYAGSPEARLRSPDKPLFLTQSNWQTNGELAEEQLKLMKTFYLRPWFIAKQLIQRDISIDRMFQGARALLMSRD